MIIIIIITISNRLWLYVNKLIEIIVDEFKIWSDNLERNYN